MAFPDISRGIKYMLIAVFFFSFVTLSVKMLPHLPAEEISFVRGFVVSLAIIFWLKRQKEPVFGHNRPILLARGLFGGISMVAFFYAIQMMPMATAVIFQYLSSVLVAVFAAWFLGEKLLPRTMIFFAISMLGVVLVRGFDTRVTTVGLVFGLINACFSAAAYTAIGKLKGKENPSTIVFYLAFISGIISFALLLFRQSWKMPNGLDWFWLAVQSISALLGQFYMTQAYLHEKSANVAIVNYLGIFFALGFGYFIWGETYNLQAAAGLILVLAGVFLSVFWTKGTRI